MGTLDATIAKATFEALMASLRCTPTRTTVEEYTTLARHEAAELALDHLEPALKEVAAMYGRQYLRPELSDEGERLLLGSQAKFFKTYAYAITHAHKDCLGGMMLFI